MIKIFLLTLLLSFNLEAKTSKEIWLEYTGTNFCKPTFCADGIPSLPLSKTLQFYKKNQKIINNTDFLAIIDFSKKSTEKRMFILNLNNGSVEKLLVTHGKKSEGETAIAKYFSNTLGSEMSSLGFYVTDAIPYTGKHGISLRLDGLSKTNSNARERNIVLHGADYATDWFVEEKGRLGLSQGCPAVSPDKINGVINKLKGEALLYIYSVELSL